MGIRREKERSAISRQRSAARKPLLITLCTLAIVAATYCFRQFWLLQLAYVVALPEASVIRPATDILLIPGADYVRSDAFPSLRRVAPWFAPGETGSIWLTCAESYGVSECEIARESIERLGYPGSLIHPVPLEWSPDDIEAGRALKIAYGTGARKIAVLLPNYKARRLGRIYSERGWALGLEVTVVPVASDLFQPERWWQSRESRKLWTYEILRLVGML